MEVETMTQGNEWPQCFNPMSNFVHLKCKQLQQITKEIKEKY